MSNHGIQAQSVGSGVYATLYAPTVFNKLEFGSGIGPEPIGPASDRHSIVKSAEAAIRYSREYKAWVAYLKEVVPLRTCFVLGNINGNDEVAVEMHHFPFTLYDICWMVSGRQKAENGRYSSFTIADEVLGLHASWQVGVVPLCKTVHELVHSKIIPLSLDQVWGLWRNLYEKYNLYVLYTTRAEIDAASRYTPEQVARAAAAVIYGPSQQ